MAMSAVLMEKPLSSVIVMIQKRTIVLHKMGKWYLHRIRHSGWVERRLKQTWQGLIETNYSICMDCEYSASLGATRWMFSGALHCHDSYTMYSQLGNCAWWESEYLQSMCCLSLWNDGVCVERWWRSLVCLSLVLSTESVLLYSRKCVSILQSYSMVLLSLLALLHPQILHNRPQNWDCHLMKRHDLTGSLWRIFT